jgi:hypothetical protein
MTDTLNAGTLFLEDGTVFPEAMTVSVKQYLSGWLIITSDTIAEMTKAIEGAGWTFFYMAGELHANGYGSSDEARTDQAMAHLLAAAKSERCNCLEISQVKRKSFLGFQYTSIIGHARHIQKSRRFESLPE